MGTSFVSVLLIAQARNSSPRKLLSSDLVDILCIFLTENTSHWYGFCGIRGDVLKHATFGICAERK